VFLARFDLHIEVLLIFLPQLGAMKLENEKLDDEAERYLGKYVMEAKARRRLDLRLAMLRDMLEERK
jgi:hypothetical protein